MDTPHAGKLVRHKERGRTERLVPLSQEHKFLDLRGSGNEGNLQAILGLEERRWSIGYMDGLSFRTSVPWLLPKIAVCGISVLLFKSHVACLILQVYFRIDTEFICLVVIR